MRAALRRAAPHALAVFSSAMLTAALGFQYVEGLAPCHLCNIQRAAHAAAACAAAAAIAVPRARRAATGAACAALLAGSAAAFFHVGVEHHWWEAACASAGIPSGDPSQIFAALPALPGPRCDDLPWSFLGLSLAGWNGLLSLAAVACVSAVLLLPERKRH